MNNIDFQELVVRYDVFQVRVLVLIAQSDKLTEVAVAASIANLDSTDYSEWKLEHLAPETRYLPLSEQRLYQDLDEIAANRGFSDWIVLRGLDVPLAQLDEQQRASFWSLMFQSFRKRPRGIVIVLQEHAEILIPVAERTAAERSKRLVRL